MLDPATTALVHLNKVIEDHAHECILHPKVDLYGHGTQVGEYAGLMRAVSILKNAMSASEEADAKL